MTRSSRNSFSSVLWNVTQGLFRFNHVVSIGPQVANPLFLRRRPIAMTGRMQQTLRRTMQLEGFRQIGQSRRRAWRDCPAEEPCQHMHTKQKMRRERRSKKWKTIRRSAWAREVERVRERIQGARIRQTDGAEVGTLKGDSLHAETRHLCHKSQVLKTQETLCRL